MMRRIAFDFDGVIADTNKEKARWLKNKKFNLKSTDKTSFYKELSETFEKNEVEQLYKEMSKNIFTPQVLEKTEPVEGAINTIRKLSENFEVYIITARTEEMIKQVKQWLKGYNIDQNINEIISSSYEKKQDICLKNDICFLCDDDLRHISESKIEIRVWFNKMDLNDCKDFFVTGTWDGIEKILQKFLY